MLMTETSEGPREPPYRIIVEFGQKRAEKGLKVTLMTETTVLRGSQDPVPGRLISPFLLKTCQKRRSSA